MKTAVFWEVTPCKLVNRYKRTAAIFMAKVSLTWKEVLNDGREQVLVVYFHTKCLQLRIYIYTQGDSFGTKSRKMRMSQRLFIRFRTCIYDYIPCFMKSMSVLEEMLEMFATTVHAELNATLHVCESGL